MATQKTISYQNLGKLKSKIGKTLSESKISDIEYEADMFKGDEKMRKWQEGITRLTQAKQIYDTAKVTGDKMDETNEWVNDQKNVSAVTEETWYGEKVKGYQVEGTDKMWDWEDMYAKKEQQEADMLADIEVGDGGMTGKPPNPIAEGHASQMRDRETLMGLSKEAGFGDDNSVEKGNTFWDWGKSLDLDFESDDYSRTEDKAKGIVGGSTDWEKMLQSVMTR
jgi:hypothetical protein